MPPAGSMYCILDDCKWLVRYRQFQSSGYLNQIVLIYKNSPEFNDESMQRVPKSLGHDAVGDLVQIEKITKI
jgi:hypothetical protein